jgi:outer membrane biosynthesis protein TonB
MYTLFLLAELAHLLSFVAPGYPPNAVNGTTIIAEARYVPGGQTEVKLLNGDGAFADAALSALQKWRFDARESGSATVVVHFRDPNLYSTGPATRTIDPAPRSITVPYPRVVVDPPYPPNFLSEGSVLIRADISPGGSVTRAEAIQGIAGLTEASLSSVRQWRFQPARDSSGRAAISSVYVVFVFRIPVNSPMRPPEH